jgi:hypothetical protein
MKHHMCTSLWYIGSKLYYVAVYIYHDNIVVVIKQNNKAMQTKKTIITKS